jgi:hypothetical protein
MREPNDKLIEQAFLAGYLVEGTCLPFGARQAEDRLHRRPWPPKIIELCTPTSYEPPNSAL